MIPRIDGIQNTMLNMILQNDLSRIIQCRLYRRQLNQYLTTISAVLHHPLNRLQMTNGSGQTIEYRFSIGMDVTMAVGMIVYVRIHMTFMGMLIHRPVGQHMRMDMGMLMNVPMNLLLALNCLSVCVHTLLFFQLRLSVSA